MNQPLYYQKEDVMPYTRGMWEEILKSVCGLKPEVFNKKHQPCPHCGGNDRFRWTDKVNEKGDGGAVCNACGNTDGIGWLMKLTGEPYSECVNIIGRFLGKQPQEYVIKKNRIASRDPGYSFSASVEPEKCSALMQRTIELAVTPLTIFEGLGGESYRVGVKSLPDGSESLTHVIPCHLVTSDGPDDDEVVNVLMINADTGSQSFYGKKVTYGSVAVTGKTEKAIYLVVDWIDSQHVNLTTGQEVWTCFTPENLEMVASRYKGDREMRVACMPSDKETLYMADDRALKVLIPNDGGYRSGMRRQLFNASELI
jgi:phage/plasmid primase-like uncharacterized protein